MTQELNALTAHELGERFRDGLSPVRVVEAVLNEAHTKEPGVNALTHIDTEGAISSAEESEKRWQAGKPRGPLDGVPVSIKELLPVRSWPLRRGSLAFDSTPQPHDAPLVKQFRDQGAVLWAQTASAEFGWKPLDGSLLNGPTDNPLCPGLTPGGSSAGGAAAVAAGYGPLTIGTDAAGSVRIPAGFCGLAAIKPSRGFMDIPGGAFAFYAASGPIARTAADLRLVHSALFGADPVTTGISGARVGVVQTIGQQLTPEPACLDGLQAATDVLSAAGAAVQSVDWSHIDLQDVIVTLWETSLAASFSAFSAEKRDLVDPGALAMAEIGRQKSATDVLNAQTRSNLWALDLEKLFEELDFIITPTTACLPFETGRMTPQGWPEENWLSWIPYTYPFNISGHPAVSIPAGTHTDGRPRSVQIVAGRGQDDRLLSWADELQQGLSLHSQEATFASS